MELLINRGVFKPALSPIMNVLALTVSKIPEVVKSLYPHFHKLSAAITVYITVYTDISNI